MRKALGETQTLRAGCSNFTASAQWNNEHEHVTLHLNKMHC